MPDLWDLLLEGLPQEGGSQAAAAAGAAAGPATRLQALLPPALALLQRYVCFPAESAALLGVDQLHGLLQAAAPALDAAGWEAAVRALEELCLCDPWGPEAEGPDDTPRGGGNLLAAVARADAVRRRSQLAVLLQRVLDSLLARQGQALPASIQLQLLDLLYRTVLAAAEANADPSRRLEAERALAAGAAAAAQARVATGGKGFSAGGGAAWALAADATGGAASPAWAAVASMPPGVDDDTEAGPWAGGAAVPDWERLRPALVRQEAEGGCLYIAALQRCIAAAGSGGGGGDGALASECEARLATFCLWVVSRAADRVASQSGGSDGCDATAGPEGSAGAAPAASSSPGVAPLDRDSAPNPADQPWEDAVRCAEGGRQGKGEGARLPWDVSWAQAVPLHLPKFSRLARLARLAHQLCPLPLLQAAPAAHISSGPAPAAC